MKFFPKKSLGQNFLIDKNIIENIVKIGFVKNTDRVLEIGAGTGNLTEKIINKKPKSFTVIEKDKRLAEYLFVKFGNKIKIINEDVLNYNYNSELSNELIIFGNLPYNISTQILVSWIRINKLNQFCKRFVLLFQKEVADRIVAKHGAKNYGRLSVLANLKLTTQKVLEIEPKMFKPVPKVQSSLVLLEPKKNIFKVNNIKKLEHITNIFFNQKRKMIKKPMKFLFKNYEEVANNLGIDLTLRPQNLSPDLYYKICNLYDDLNK